MAGIIRDTMDFAAYERATEASQKVRRASEFVDDMEREFGERSGPAHPTMTSTKAKNLIEFRPGEVTGWAGFNGHRKSMFTSQLALDLCAQQQRTLVASFEMQPGKTLARMARQMSAVARPAEVTRRRFAKWTDGRLWLFDHQGRTTAEAVIGLCRYFAQELKGRHVFVDSLMMVCPSEDTLDQQAQFVGDLCGVAKDTDLHVHLVLHSRKPQSGDESKPPSKYDIRGAAAISDKLDNVVTVWMNKRRREVMEAGPSHRDYADLEGKPDALVTVEKQRNAEWEGRMQLWFHQPSLRFCDSRSEPIEPYELQEPA